MNPNHALKAESHRLAAISKDESLRTESALRRQDAIADLRLIAQIALRNGLGPMVEYCREELGVKYGVES